jgi:hypothetical protein
VVNTLFEERLFNLVGVVGSGDACQTLRVLRAQDFRFSSRRACP